MNKTIGIFGGGQLGRMMAQAALPLNIQCTFFEANTDCPSSAMGQVISSQTEQGLQQFIDSADVFSLEFENTPLADVDVLTQSKQLHPPRQALATAQNRLLEKALFDQLAIPVAPYRAVDSLESLKQAVVDLGLPIVLKTATGGYDGKGQFVLRSEDQIDTAWAELGPAKSLIAESFVKFSLAKCRLLRYVVKMAMSKHGHWLKTIIITVSCRIRLCLRQTVQTYNLWHKITLPVC